MITDLKERLTGRLKWGEKRHKDWPRVRAEHLKEFNWCVCCGSVTKLEVHHIIPFYVRPDLELDPKNLVTLCSSKRWGFDCHRWLGHLGDWRKINPHAVIDAHCVGSRISMHRFKSENVLKTFTQ